MSFAPRPLLLLHTMILVCILLLPAMTYAGSPEMIVLQEDRQYCLTTPNNARIGSSVTLSRCDRNSKAQYWRFDNRGLWCTESNKNLCVTVPNASNPRQGDQLSLMSRNNNQRYRWYYNDSRDKELQIFNSQDLCVTYNRNARDPRPVAGARAQMERCNSRSDQSWVFQYDTPDKPGDNWELVRLRENRSWCVSFRRSFLQVVRCNSSDQTQHWRFQDDATWRPRIDTDLCVSVDNRREGENLVLERCRSANNRRWHHNERGNRQITPSFNSRLCASRDSTDRLRLYSCTGRRNVDTWDFVHAN